MYEEKLNYLHYRFKLLILTKEFEFFLLFFFITLYILLLILISGKDNFNTLNYDNYLKFVNQYSNKLVNKTELNNLFKKSTFNTFYLKNSNILNIYQVKVNRINNICFNQNLPDNLNLNCLNEFNQGLKKNYKLCNFNNILLNINNCLYIFDNTNKTTINWSIVLQEEFLSLEIISYTEEYKILNNIIIENQGKQYYSIEFLKPLGLKFGSKNILNISIFLLIISFLYIIKYFFELPYINNKFIHILLFIFELINILLIIFLIRIFLNFDKLINFYQFLKTNEFILSVYYNYVIIYGIIFIFRILKIFNLIENLKPIILIIKIWFSTIFMQLKVFLFIKLFDIFLIVGFLFISQQSFNINYLIYPFVLVNYNLILENLKNNQQNYSFIYLIILEFYLILFYVTIFGFLLNLISSTFYKFKGLYREEKNILINLESKKKYLFKVIKNLENKNFNLTINKKSIKFCMLNKYQDIYDLEIYQSKINNIKKYEVHTFNKFANLNIFISQLFKINEKSFINNYNFKVLINILGYKKRNIKLIKELISLDELLIFLSNKDLKIYVAIYMDNFEILNDNEIAYLKNIYSNLFFIGSIDEVNNFITWNN